MYATPSEDYISTNVNSKALNYILDTLCNISSILGDTNGKMTRTTATEVVKALDISATGALLSSTEVITDFSSPHLPEEMYVPEVSYDSYLTYTYAKSGDLDYVLTIVDNWEISSPLLVLTREPHVPAYVAIRGLYLETFTVYKQAVELKTLDTIQTDRLITNCKVVASYVAKQGKVNYDLLEVLKNLRVSLMYLRHYSYLLKEEGGI
jgi:hypothetical protein